MVEILGSKSASFMDMLCDDGNKFAIKMDVPITHEIDPKQLNTFLSQHGGSCNKSQE